MLYKKMTRLQKVYVANFISAACAGVILIVREYWLLLPLLVSATYAYKNKPEDKDEKERLNDFSNKVMAGSAMLIIAIVFFAVISLMGYILIKKNI